MAAPTLSTRQQTGALSPETPGQSPETLIFPSLDDAA